MRIQHIFYWFAALVASFLVYIAGYADTKQHNKVYLIPTLHLLHATSLNYSFDKLRNILETIKPDVILVELTEDDLKSQKQQETKIEYNQVVFPFVGKFKTRMIAMEPNEPLYSQLVQKYLENIKQTNEQKQEQVNAFGVFVELYASRIQDNSFRSIGDLTTEKYDELTKIKHDFQNKIYGEKEQSLWNQWNQIFADKIIKTCQEPKNKVIVILVGLEHHYWLKDYLENKQKISLEKIMF